MRQSMRNITVAISDTSYREARIWAASHDTSISAIVQFLLEVLSRIPPWILIDLHENVPLPRSRISTDASTKSPDATEHQNPQSAPSKEDRPEAELSISGL